MFCGLVLREVHKISVNCVDKLSTVVSRNCAYSVETGVVFYI